MKYILAEAQRELLAQHAWSNAMLALDFDGTLAPIVADPSAARMRTRTAALLAAIAKVFPTVVISGRGRDDVAERLAGIPVAAVVGNHGLEPSADMEAVARRVRRWIPTLVAGVGALAGVHIEDKVYSVAVHYRASRNRRAARAAIESVARDLGDGTRLIGGKCVVNIVPSDAPHKGFALQRLRALVGADTAIYVGDDVTDEDVFGLDEPGRLLGIRIGRSPTSRAGYYLKDQREIDHFLSFLVGLRSKSAASRRLEYV